MAIRIIQFPGAPRWRQDVQLDGQLYTLNAWWNVRMRSWFMDLSLSDGSVLLRGIRMLLNWPLFYGSDYDDRLPPGTLLVVCPTGQCRHDPGREDFQDGTMRLVYVEESGP